MRSATPEALKVSVFLVSAFSFFFEGGRAAHFGSQVFALFGKAFNRSLVVLFDGADGGNQARIEEFRELSTGN